MSEPAVNEDQQRTDGRATRWHDHKAARRDRILESAVDAINEQGNDVAVQEIADRAQLPRSVVYRLFKDRDDLDEQVRDRIVARLTHEVTPPLTSDGTAGEAVSGAIDAYLAWVVGYPKLHQFLGTGSGEDAGPPRVVSGTKTAFTVELAAQIKTAINHRNASAAIAESMAFGLVGMVDGAVNRWLADPDSALTVAELSSFLDAAIWQVLEAGFHPIGVVIDRSTRLSDL